MVEWGDATSRVATPLNLWATISTGGALLMAVNLRCRCTTPLAVSSMMDMSAKRTLQLLLRTTSWPVLQACTEMMGMLRTLVA